MKVKERPQQLYRKLQLVIERVAYFFAEIILTLTFSSIDGLGQRVTVL
jgi:hypothetical protein